MKTVYKSILAGAALLPAVALTSCIEEVFPTNGMTAEQLASSTKATEALVWGMSAYMNHYATLSSDYAYDWGYGSIIHIREVMTEDYAIVSSGYDWYTAWEQCRYMGPGYASTQFIWNFYNQLVLTANNTIGTIDPEEANDQQLCYLGMGYAFRASHYLDMARMYEFLPTNVTEPYSPEGEYILNLTVPILTDKTTEEEARNNPRATREEMAAFLLSDLTYAEEYIQKGSRGSKTQPDLAVVYGLFARYYMWLEDYPNAAKYARLAIANHSGSPTTQSEWLNTSTGFNTLSTPSWMWGAQADKEDDVVQSGILNWTSWASNETTYGYAAYGPMTMINAATYEKINDADFRKLTFMAPEGSALYGKEPMINEAIDRASIPTYGSLKFRPGDGNMDDYTVGSATAFPLMRVEEMYFIEAEATAHTSPSQGKDLLESFMKNYRYSSYTCNASDVEGVVEEIIFQKRVEFWGEGINYFDLKRLGYSVTRYYPGTNFYLLAALNTDGRPAWVNLCIVSTEGTNNAAVTKFNNPDPSGSYAAPSE